MKPKQGDLTEFSITHCLLYFISNRNTVTFFSSALLPNSPTFQPQCMCGQACTSVFVLIDKIFLYLRNSLPESLETHLVFRSQTLPLSLHSHVCQCSPQNHSEDQQAVFVYSLFQALAAQSTIIFPDRISSEIRGDVFSC